MRTLPLPALALAASLVLLTSSSADAHCDTMRGPVLAAARAALDTGNVNLALIWVKPSDEAVVREAFQRATVVRAGGGSAKDRDAADQGFFEVLVRAHRAGEGAPFEGIKPADTDVGPAVPAADKALAAGSLDDVGRLLSDTVNRGLQSRFETVVARKSYDPNDTAAGRAYVKAYVEYTHYVEGIYESANGASAHLEHSEGQGHNAGHSSGHAAHLPWFLAAFASLVALGEGGWLLARRKRSA